MSSGGLAFVGVNKGNTTTFHHFDLLRGSVENLSNKILVCLAGVGTATTVVSLIIEDVNQTVSSPVPTFAELAKCESKETFFDLRKNAKIKFKSKRIMPVPPCFIETIAQCLCVSSDPSEILLDLLPIYVEFSMSLKQDKSNPFLHSNYILQFLWLATCDDIELSVRSSVPVHPKLEDFFNNCLKRLLPCSSLQSTNINNSLVTATDMLTAVIKDTSLVMQPASLTTKKTLVKWCMQSRFIPTSSCGAA